MTPADLLRTVSAYNPALPANEQPVGTNSPQLKGDIKSLVVSSTAVAQYKELLEQAWEGSREAATAAWEMRRSGAVDASTHVSALSSLHANGHSSCTTSSFQSKVGALVPGAHFVSGQVQTAQAAPSAAASFAALIDQNGDGLISFAEFMVFITVLALPTEQLDVAFHLFDADGSGELDQREYNALLQVLRKRTAAGKMADDSAITGAASQLSQVPLPAAAAADGRPDRISFQAFHSFILDAKRLLRQIEIDRYSGGEEHLTPVQFARLVVGNAPTAMQGELVKRLQTNLPPKLQGTINMEDVHEYYMLLDNLPDLLFAMSLAGPLVAAKEGGVHAPGALTKKQFAHACAVVLTEMRKAEHAVSGSSGAVHSALSPVTIDVLFALFDADGDGRMSIQEISAAMQTHGSSGLQHREQESKDGFMGKLSCFSSCLSGNAR